jgi:hypothetical protein
MEKRTFLATALSAGVLAPSILKAATEESKAESSLSVAPSLFSAGPYLQNITPAGATVLWLTKAPCYSWVEWGMSDALGQKTHAVIDGQVVANNTLNKIRLPDLQLGKSCFYRICSREILHFGAYKVKWGRTQKSKI